MITQLNDPLRAESMMDSMPVLVIALMTTEHGDIKCIAVGSEGEPMVFSWNPDEIKVHWRYDMETGRWQDTDLAVEDELSDE